MQVLRNLVEQGRDLRLVRDVERNGGELPTLLQARIFVGGGALLGDLCESIYATSAENHIGSTLRYNSR